MSKTSPQVCIIGAGIGGLATAALLAKAGYSVDVFEAHSQTGGRTRQLKAKGFTFDTGPSWYLMPEVFEHFFSLFDTDVKSMYDLVRLKPSFKIFSELHDTPLTFFADLKKDMRTFESIERGAGEKLQAYLASAKEAYDVATQAFLYTNFSRPYNVIRPAGARAPKMLRAALKPIDKHVRRYFSHPLLQQILEYPMVFLGTSPFEAPALFQLMSHMDFTQGVYYPMGGFYKIIEAIESICRQHGVRIHLRQSVNTIIVENGTARGISCDDGSQHAADIVISNSDLHYTETQLLSAEYQSYSESYWSKKQSSPSALLLYLGVSGKLPQLEHHNLLFTENWQQNFGDIFTAKKWPVPGSMYVSKTSHTDPSVAPKGDENIFVLIPIQADDTISDTTANAYADTYIDQLASMIDCPNLKKRITYRKVYGPRYFRDELHSWQGSLLGMSHKLTQSAIFRPKVKSKKVKNLYYVGANVMPGIGLPMCLISAELVYKSIFGIHSHSPVTHIEEI